MGPEYSILECTNMYPDISKIYKDIPRCTKCQAAALPPLGILYILVYLRISWIYVIKFRYSFVKCGYILVYSKKAGKEISGN